MSQISDKILAIEKELDLEKFTYRGENVWPIIRMVAYISSTKTTNVSSFSPWRAVKFLLEGALLFFYNVIRRKISRKRYDAVVITSSHYKVKENNQTFDKIIDPVLNYLQDNNKSFSVWEFTAKYRYDNDINYRSFLRPIQKEIYFLSVLRKLIRVFNKKTTLHGDVSKLNSLLRQHDIKFSVDANFINKLEVIFSQADFFQKHLAVHDVKFVFVVCYYDIKCFSILLAANRLGIRSVDMQHGIQGLNHLGYAHWPEVIFSHTRFLPTHFYVWDENSYQAIMRWRKDDGKVLLGCNKWFLDRARKVSNDIILLTLQPIDDFLPEYVITMIQRYEGDKLWYIRLHPRQLGDMDKVEAVLAKAGVSAKVNVRNASSSPLTALLERTVLHATVYSSVAIEASYYNIPTYFLSEKHLMYYADYLNDELIYYYPKHNIAEVINTVLQEKTISSYRHEDRVTVLDKFIHGQ